VPVTVPWRQPFSVPRPDMGGVHSAVVLGPSGQEIYTDEYGRVKVRFFWDYRHEATADLTIWARVVQPWAGNGWGTQFIPRVGTEVAVAFVDGDADRPIVLGGLYNGDQKPIYPLAQKTSSGLRTRSTPQGGTSEFNELTFDDNKGEELVFLQAQKDFSGKVKHDQTLDVGHDRTVTVGNAERITVGEGRTTQITEKDDTLTVAQGDLSVSISQGKATITAMQSIELIVGSSSIRIDQNGVTVKGMLINVDADASVSIDAPMVSVSGDATTTITGGLVKIN
jgi:type VI secretion system secreted protein VgrG